MRTCTYIFLIIFIAALNVDVLTDEKPKDDPLMLGKPYFTNIATELGLKSLVAYRTQWIDVNSDNYPDLILFGTKGEEQVSLWLSEKTEDGIKFKDFSKESGLRDRTTQLLVAGDIDNDGDVDLFNAIYADLENAKFVDNSERSSFLLNDGKGHFTEAKAKKKKSEKNDEIKGKAPADFPSTVCAACFADVNNDGNIDLYTGSWYRKYGESNDAYPDRLYINKGKGVFEDVTKDSGMMLDASFTDRLTEDEKSGKVELTKERLKVIGRYSHRPTYGVAHCDYDNDGDQDLFTLAYGRQWNLHWRNNGDGTFTEIAEETKFDGDEDENGVYADWVKRQAELPFRSNGNTFDCSFGDYDNDGDFDCVFGEIRHFWAGASSDGSQILTNQGKSKKFAFEREIGVLPRKKPLQNWNEGDMNVSWIDFDNDGYLDLLISTSDYPDYPETNRLKLYWQNTKTHKFENITDFAGFNWDCSTQISLADFDRDGDVDIVIGNTHTRLPKERKEAMPLQVAVFRNDVGNLNNFISITLEGAGKTGANKSAIGAVVEIEVKGKTQKRFVSGGNGHMGHQDDFTLTFGIGKAKGADKLTISWGGKKNRVEKYKKLKANRFYFAREGKGIKDSEGKQYTKTN